MLLLKNPFWGSKMSLIPKELPKNIFTIGLFSTVSLDLSPFFLSFNDSFFIFCIVISYCSPPNQITADLDG
jgi:hypothetical protein